MFRNRLIPVRRKGAATPIPVAMAPQAVIVPKETPVQQLGEKDTQPLWHRLVIAPTGAAQVLQGNTRIQLFNQQKNQAPHLTNLDVAGQMSNTTRFTVAGIELRVNPDTDNATFAQFVKATRLVIEIGAKNFEKVNQPTIMFPALASVKGGGGVDFTTEVRNGLYILNPGEEIVLAESQTFNARFEVDPTGFTIADGRVLDLVVVFKGQKQAVLSL